MLKLTIASGLVLAALTGGAFAADLSLPAQAPAPVAAAPGGWDGAYIGAHIGYGPGTVHADGGPLSYFDDFSFSGGFIGGQVGYNFSLGDGNGVVLGVEADGNWANETGDNSNDTTGSDHYTDSIGWTAAVTGHIGYAMDNFMPYILGGAAWAGNTLVDTDDTDVAYPAGFSETQTHTGYTVGAGLAAKLADNVTGFAEYRYSNYGSVDYVDAPGVSLTDNSVRVGLNYHF